MEIKMSLDTQDPLTGKIVVTSPCQYCLTVDEARKWIKDIQQGVDLLEHLKDCYTKVVEAVLKNENV